MVIATQVNDDVVKQLDRIAAKFSMSRAAMLRAAVTEFVNNHKRLLKRGGSGGTLADKIIDLLVENGDITN